MDEDQPIRRNVLQADVRRPDSPKRTGLSGDGQRLMIVVLVVVGVLCVSLLVLSGWLAHRALTAIERHQDTEERSYQAPAPPPSMNPADWITADDYPIDALRNGDEGTVSIRWTVTPDGRVRDCAVTASSGHASLDAAACRAIVRSGLYPPVAAGAPARVFTRRVVWKMPQ